MALSKFSNYSLFSPQPNVQSAKLLRQLLQQICSLWSVFPFPGAKIYFHSAKIAITPYLLFTFPKLVEITCPPFSSLLFFCPIG